MTRAFTRISCVAASLLLLAGCGAQPKHINMRADQVSGIEVLGGPLGASVLIDGVEVWRLQGNGKDKLPVSDGEHAVRITHNGSEVYGRVIFIQDGTRKIIKLP